MQNVIIITGQTATGKTELALELAEKCNGELVNCDSRQIYKHLDIISGKDLTNDRYRETRKMGGFSVGYYTFDTHARSKIWLYDIISPKEYFSSFDYQQCALFTIKHILDQGKTPIIVGGTYFYLYHLLYSVETENIKPNWELRERFKNSPLKRLQDELKKINRSLFESLNESEKQNPQRLIRKIEVSLIHNDFNQESLQKKLSLEKKLSRENLQVEFLGLKYKDRAAELDSIKTRVTKRVEEGAVQEVRAILAKGYTKNDPGMKTIGYQQMIDFLMGTRSKEEMLEAWITKEMQYAKRQFTFMKRDTNIAWREV